MRNSALALTLLSLNNYLYSILRCVLVRLRVIKTILTYNAGNNIRPLPEWSTNILDSTSLESISDDEKEKLVWAFPSKAANR